MAKYLTDKLLMKLSDFSNKPPKKYATSVYVFMWYSTYFFPADSEPNIFHNYLYFLDL